MNHSWLTIRDLEYVVAVAKHLHFAKAAEACKVSQPALSTQVKKIEDWFKTKFFERNNRKVSLTEAGRTFVEQANRLLEEAQKLSQLAVTNVPPFSQTFSLGAIATLGPYWIPYFLPKLRKSYPKGKFHFKEGLTHTLIRDLKNNELDVVLLADTVVDESLLFIPIFYEPFVVACSKGDEHFKPGQVSIRNIKPDEMVLLEDGHCLKDQILDFCTSNKAKVKPSFQTTSLETLKHLVASGLGYTLLPWLAVPADKKINQLIEYKDLKEKVGRKIVLACRKSFSRMSEVNALCEILKKSLPTDLSPIP